MYVLLNFILTNINYVKQVESLWNTSTRCEHVFRVPVVFSYGVPLFLEVDLLENDIPAFPEGALARGHVTVRPVCQLVHIHFPHLQVQKKRTGELTIDHCITVGLRRSMLVPSPGLTI